MYHNSSRHSYYQQHHGENLTPLKRGSVDPRRLRKRMVRDQIEARGIADPLLLQAMNTVPRHLFVPEAFQAHAYDDTALPIGQGQTISRPYMVARMTAALNLRPGMRIMEVGMGCGYQAAILAAMGCIVFGIERLEELCNTTRARLQRMSLRNIHVYRGDGTLGFSAAAPFERILVSAGGPKIPPPLIAQLDLDGLLVIPVGDKPRNQRLIRIRKGRSTVEREDLGPATFVDLIGNHGWER